MKRTAVLALTGLALLTAPAWADDKGTATTIDGLKSTAPAAWKAKEAAGSRVYYFILPKEKGDKFDGELIVSYFNGQGGTRTSAVEA